MKNEAIPATVRMEMEIRISYPSEAGMLARILKTLRGSGGELHAQLIYRLHDRSAAFFLCENPTEGALALQREGLKVETETVVTVRTPNRPGTFSYLIQTLEAEDIQIGYCYSTSTSEEILMVFRTSNNPMTEDVLRNYLLYPDLAAPFEEGPEGGEVNSQKAGPRKGSS